MPAAEAGFFPLDRQLELGREGWSPGLARDVVWLSGALPSLGLVREALVRLGGPPLALSTIWNQVQKAGRRFRAWEEEERAQGQQLGEPERPGEAERSSSVRLGVALDGALVHIREEGWKELKVGVVFQVEAIAGREGGRAVQPTYVAHLGGPEVLGEKVWAEARRRGWEQVPETLVLGDGAAWIWNQAALHFGTSRQVVDWWHAKAHLTAAGRLLYPEGSAALTHWLQSREERLYQGGAPQIAQELAMRAAQKGANSSELTQAATYFRTHQARMQYRTVRTQGWPIGSGVVESGAKQFKARLCGPGMRWSRSGAQHMVALRAAVLSQRFDPIWNAAVNSPPF